VPIGLWALGLLAVIARLSLSRQERLSEKPPTTNDQRRTPRLRDEFILLFPATVIFAVVSSKTGFSEHFRYVSVL